MKILILLLLTLSIFQFCKRKAGPVDGAEKVGSFSVSEETCTESIDTRTNVVRKICGISKQLFDACFQKLTCDELKKLLREKNLETVEIIITPSTALVKQELSNAVEEFGRCAAEVANQWVASHGVVRRARRLEGALNDTLENVKIICAAQFEVKIKNIQAKLDRQIQDMLDSMSQEAQEIARLLKNISKELGECNALPKFKIRIFLPTLAQLFDASMLQKIKNIVNGITATITSRRLGKKVLTGAGLFGRIIHGLYEGNVNGSIAHIPSQAAQAIPLVVQRIKAETGMDVSIEFTPIINTQNTIAISGPNGTPINGPNGPITPSLTLTDEQIRGDVGEIMRRIVQAIFQLAVSGRSAKDCPPPDFEKIVRIEGEQICRYHEEIFEGKLICVLDIISKKIYYEGSCNARLEDLKKDEATKIAGCKKFLPLESQDPNPLPPSDSGLCSCKFDGVNCVFTGVDMLTTSTSGECSETKCKMLHDVKYDPNRYPNDPCIPPPSPPILPTSECPYEGHEDGEHQLGRVPVENQNAQANFDNRHLEIDPKLQGCVPL